MRIIVNGQQAFGKACLEALLDAGGHDVVGVFTTPDRPGAAPDPLKEAAVARGIPVLQPTTFADETVLRDIESLRADLMILVYTTTFVPREARELPTHGSICFHPSLLPRHRGPSSINWPIIWGENTTGLTIFWPDDGLDEGDILLQREVEIGPDDTLGTVYFSKIFPLGVEAILEAVQMVAAGDAPRIAQDDSRATYEGWCRQEQAAIDWWRPAREVYDLIRGSDPQPGAWTTHEGKVVQLYDCRRVEAFGRPGEVAAVSDTGFTVVAGGGGIAVGRVRADGGPKVRAGEFAAPNDIVVGSRFGHLGRP